MDESSGLVRPTHGIRLRGPSLTLSLLQLPCTRGFTSDACAHAQSVHTGTCSRALTATPLHPHLVEPLDAPMQSIGAIVHGRLVLLVVDLERSLGDPVRTSARDTSEKRAFLLVVRNTVEAQHYI